jgi:hypothetical protein
MNRSSRPSAERDTEQIDRLTAAVERLADEVRVLRDVLDELREDFRWASRNDKLGGAVFMLTSMPADAAAEDWPERVNRYSADHLPVEDSASGAARQASLW